MKISEINRIIESYAACRFDQSCRTCPMAYASDYCECRNILDHRVMDALERLKQLESSLYTVHVSNIESDVVFEHFIVKDENNNNEIRLHNTLRRHGISTVSHFADTDPKTIMRMRNVGRKLIAIAEERHKEARELLNLEPVEFDPGDITFILDMKHYPEEYKKSYGYYD